MDKKSRVSGSRRKNMSDGTKEKLDSIVSKTLEKMQSVKTTEALNEIRVSVLGKKGELKEVMKGMKDVAPEDRPKVGQMVNEARDRIESELAEMRQRLDQEKMERQLEGEKIDVTLPARKADIGHRHPNTIALEEMERIFIGMGYEVVEGPEIEWDEYNFTKLNIPPNHPAKDEQDTFYINKDIVLRTQTSGVQAHTMLERKPPIRIICPGRVYRADEVDATHSPVFHQLEGLVIDKDVTMADLKGTLDIFAQSLFGKDVTTRFRPSFFPFTEPSAEVDLTCMACHGKGCRVCKGTGWIEVLGAGMVNPKVLEMCGIDSSVYGGFAFGIGIERIAMLHYGITDMRLLYEGDVRFLSQFRED